MEEMIIIRLNPTELQHEIYIMSNNEEYIPLVHKCVIDEIPAAVAKFAAKYNIHYIKLAGAKTYVEEIRNKVTEKIATCFGANNDFMIELF